MKTKLCMFVLVMLFSLNNTSAIMKDSSMRKFRNLDKPGEVSSGLPVIRKRAAISCSAETPLCKCRRRGTLVCSKTNCLEHLPTRNMTQENGEQIRNVIVTRQKNFTAILSGDLALLSNLRSARLYGNGIYIINADAFISTRKLEILDLHRNKLRYLPAALRQLPNLRRLNLGKNEIKLVSGTALVNLQNLQHLILRDNKLTTFPQNLPRTLTKLSLSNNRLSNVGDLRYLETLRILKLSSNRFHQVFSSALPVSLKELNMCNNMLTTASPLSFANLHQLTRLYLAGNVGITRVHQSTFFHSSSPLKELDLRNCKIEELESDAFSYFPKLRAVDLAENELTKYKPEWFQYNGKLIRVTLAGNKWKCNCAFAQNIDDLERAVQDNLNMKDDSNTKSRKDKAIDDFENILCAQFDTDFEHTLTQNQPFLNHSLNSLDISRCLTKLPRWRFKAPPFNIEETKVRGSKPQLTTTRPTTTTRRPTTMTKRPTTTTRRPTTTTRKPTTTTRSPTTTTRRPTTTSRRPTTTTRRPTTTTRSPTTTTRRPTTTTRRPTTTTRRPTTTTRRPTTTTRRKTTTTRRPTTTSRRPTTTTRRPTTTTRSPTTTTRRPTTTTRRPTTTTRRPTTTTRRPTTTTRRKTTTTRRPTTTTRRPTTTTTRPTTTIVLSTTTKQHSTKLMEIIRHCTVSGIDCVLPFEFNGESHTTCVPHSYYTSSTWCYTNLETEDWDYCQQC